MAVFHRKSRKTRQYSESSSKGFHVADTKRGKTRAGDWRVMVNFGCSSDWMKKWCEFLSQLCGIVDGKPITF